MANVAADHRSVEPVHGFAEALDGGLRTRSERRVCEHDRDHGLATDPAGREDLSHPRHAPRGRADGG